MSLIKQIVIANLKNAQQIRAEFTVINAKSRNNSTIVFEDYDENTQYNNAVMAIEHIYLKYADFISQSIKPPEITILN